MPGGEALIVGTGRGQILRLDPSRAACATVDAGLGEIAALDVHPDGQRYVAASTDGRRVIGTLAGEVVHRCHHPLSGGMQALLTRDHALLADSRTLLVLDLESGAVTRQVLPERVVLSLAPDGAPMLCRSTSSGPRVIPLGHPFPEGEEPTGHRLRASGRYVLGFDAASVWLWGEDGTPRSMRLPDVTAGDVSRDGRSLGLGTKNGAVALVSVDQIGLRRRPAMVRAFSDPVTTVAFAEHGRVLATGAETLRFWSWG
jgi:hypothetical protein